MAEQHALFDVERTWRVGELSARLAKVVASAFPTEVWVQGEVDGHRPAGASGHVYFSLCERNSRRGPTSSMSVALFRSQREQVERSLRDWPDFRLRNGLEVRIRARVQYSHNRLQLVMSAIDPVHTLGRLAADRERVLRALASEGLIDRNARLAMPPAPLTVGLVTSPGSAACEDVLHELEASGFAFRVLLAGAQVQGVGSEAAVVRALHTVATHRPDVVLLVRGGGARTDLATFDGDRVARAVASCPVPVVTGVGHEIDSSVADEVAHTACKTPTAAAALLVARVAASLAAVEATAPRLVAHADAATVAATASVDRRARRIGDRARARLAAEDARLDRCRRQVDPGRLRPAMARHEAALARAARDAGSAATRRLTAADSRLDVLGARAEAADPARILARGFTITRDASGQLVRSAGQVEAGDSLVTTFADGRASATVTSVEETDG